MPERRLLLQLWPFLLAALALHASLLWLGPEPSGGLPAGTGSVGPPMQVTLRPVASPDVTDKVANPSSAEAADSERVRGQAATGHAMPVPSIPGSPPSSPFGDDAFLPRSRLTIPPAPLANIVIEYPLAEGVRRHYVGELSLFIDETGRVVRIRSDGTPLPQALDDAAREAFAKARFTPGELEGRKVRSRIRVEVTFDERPRTAPPDAGQRR